MSSVFILLLLPVFMLVLLLSCVVYCLIVSSFIYNGLQRDFEYAYIKLLGRFHAHACCLLSIKVLEAIGAYTCIMNLLAKNVASSDSKNHICCIGDSLFTFWNAIDVDLNGLTVSNGGFGGATSMNVLTNIHRICLPRPRMVWLHVGGNDFDIYGATCLNTVIKNIQYICSNVNCPVYYIVTPRKPVFSDEKWTFLLNIASLAKIHCTVIYLKSENLTYFTDGLHYTPLSYTRLASDLKMHFFS